MKRKLSISRVVMALGIIANVVLIILMPQAKMALAAQGYYSGYYSDYSPTISVSPVNLSFSDQHIGVTSAAKNVTLTNTSNTGLIISSIASSISVFYITHNCSTILAAGQSCNISVSFKPNTVGTRLGAIVFKSNASGSPHNVIATGVGVASNSPICTLTARPGEIAKGASSTLIANCSPAVASFSWTGGTCAGTTTDTCQVTPSVTTNYSATGINSYGAGTATATVKVKSADLNSLMLLLLD